MYNGRERNIFSTLELRKEGRRPLLILERNKEQDDAILVYQKDEDLPKLMEDLQARYAANRRPYRVIGDVPDKIIAILARANLQLIFEDKRKEEKNEVDPEVVMEVGDQEQVVGSGR